MNFPHHLKSPTPLTTCANTALPLKIPLGAVISPNFGDFFTPPAAPLTSHPAVEYPLWPSTLPYMKLCGGPERISFFPSTHHKTIYSRLSRVRRIEFFWRKFKSMCDSIINHPLEACLLTI